MTPDNRYAQLKALSISVPNLGSGRQAKAPSEPEALKWLGKLAALVRQKQYSTDHISLTMAMNRLGTMAHDSGVSEIMLILYRTLASAELEAPEAARGAFIAVGNAHDAYAAVSNLMQSATNSILIVDPYLAGSVVSKFATSAPEQITLMLLSDSKSVYPDLAPATMAFRQQYSNLRPIEVRVTAPGALHDRLIILDATDVWDLSQSLKDLATRSPAAVARTNNELSALKATHNLSAWNQAKPLI